VAVFLYGAAYFLFIKIRIVSIVKTMYNNGCIVKGKRLQETGFGRLTEGRED
jgi:hypothetical protein